MRHISPQSVEVHNFKSFAHAKIDLRRGPGLRMVFGENRKEPRLGANGAGKSTIFDALEFCASGRSVRGKRASDLVTTGQKAMWVETTYRIDDELRTVKRSFSPERVYVDGELSDQRSVDQLLGLTRERRLSSVIFGQAVDLFIDRPVPERGDLLDEVLGLGFWMRAADLATSKWTAANVDLQKIQRELARLDGALAELPTDESLLEAIILFGTQRDVEVAALREKRKPIETEHRNARRALLAIPDGAEDEANRELTTAREWSSHEASEVAVARAEVQRLAEEIELADGLEECPTCGQAIDRETIDSHLDHLGLQKAAADQSLADATARLGEAREAVEVAMERHRTERERSRERHALSLEASNKRGEVSAIDNRIAMLLDQANPYEEQRRATERRRVEIVGQLAKKEAEVSALSARIGKLDYWRQGFRRVRVFCLARVLRELEVTTMGEARSLGLVGWRIGFTGETETKSGTVKLGVRAVVESPEAKRDFDSWSPGEGQRVRVASALGLGSLIQRYSGVSYDLEVWDEPSAWLSNEGIDDLFECLRERAHARGKSIWVCDPRAGVAHGGFDEVWNVIKTEEGSRIEVVRPDRAAVLLRNS